MPSRGDPKAPKFDPSRPRELRPYFEELDFHFRIAGITDGATQKLYSRRYLDVDTADLWESLPEFSDPSKSFDEFKSAIVALYPGAEDERKWSVADLNDLVLERSRIGIMTLGDFGDYYRRFLAVTAYLRSKNRLSQEDQCRKFLDGLHPELRGRVLQRLQLLLPAHYPDDPYALSEVEAASRFVLHGTTTTVRSPTSTPVTTTQVVVKTEDPPSSVEALAQALQKALFPQGNAPARAQQTGAGPRREGGACNFCGGTDHFIRECGVVQDYITAGKIRRDVEGRVVLSTGAFVPRGIPGRWLRERVDEWHRQNPGQLAQGQLMLDVLPQ